MPQNNWRIRFGGISDGPDIIGRGRHRTLLNKIFLTIDDIDCDGLRPGFLLRMAGPFSTEEYQDKVRSVRFYRDGHVGIDLDISQATILLPEEEYRARLIKLLRSGIENMVLRAKKKHPAFQPESLLAGFEKGLSIYASIPLPLAATNSEIEFAEKWLGVPREPDEPT